MLCLFSIRPSSTLKIFPSLTSGVLCGSRALHQYSAESHNKGCFGKARAACVVRAPKVDELLEILVCSSFAECCYCVCVLMHASFGFVALFLALLLLLK